MKRLSIAGCVAGICVILLSGALFAAAGPARTLAAANSHTTGARQGDAQQGCTGRVLAAKVGAGTAMGIMKAGQGGLYTVTAINGQTITATANGLGFAVDASSGEAGGQVVGGGLLPGMPGPGIVTTMPLTVTITVSDSTVYTRAGHAAGLSDVQVGSVVNVEGTGAGATLSASKIEIVLPRHSGVVTAVNGANLTITGFDARTYTIATSSDTLYDRAGQTAALSDIAVGSLISAEGTPSSDTVTLQALAVSIQLPSVAGPVIAVSGDTVTVQGPDGTSATVLLTPSTTYSAKPDGTASRSSITTGSFIMAEGTIGADGSLTALRVTIANPPSAIPPAPDGAATSGSPSF